MWTRRAPISGMKIAFSADLGCYPVDADVVTNARAAADKLRYAGAVDGAEISVVNGLQTGDRIITNGANLLKDGQRVEVLQ
jgi:hypothetical protein